MSQGVLIRSAMSEFVTPFGGKAPDIDPDAYVDVSARIIGDVVLSEGVTVWPMAVLRADSSSIRIEKGSAILDLALLEAPKGCPVSVGEKALISHRAAIHGAIIESAVLVGIGAIILDGAVIHSGSIIGAGSVIPPGVHIPPNSLVMGIPGKVVRETTPKEQQDILTQLEDLYQKSRLYR
jgi:carbonic anhydrase/acetyltransferase-like protein (isoleucine patch superfamily)